MTASTLSYMGHVPTTRLMDLSQQTIIPDSEEIEHLRVCEECEQLLRIFARQFHLTRKMLSDDDVPAKPMKTAS
jgi:hypothetical protein